MGLVGNDVGVGVEEEIFNPTHITVWSNSLAAITKWVRGASPVFLRLGGVEEPQGFRFQPVYELQWESSIDNLEESKLTGFDHMLLGLGV